MVEFRVECGTCGIYITDELTNEAFQENRSEEERAMISAFVRVLFEYQSEPPRLCFCGGYRELPPHGNHEYIDPSILSIIVDLTILPTLTSVDIFTKSV